MTMTQDSGGGGTAANLCPPSPSDLAGQINNLITRIENLEKAVAELQGQDVTATQLSDLSQQVGWVYDVTYLGVPGWTQTAAGTLIPPAGLALSTLGIVLPGLGGNPSTLVSTDSDGNPTFSINNSGTTGGGGGAINSGLLTSGSNTQTPNTSWTPLTYSGINVDLNHVGFSIGSTTFTVSTSGWYHVSYNIEWSLPYNSWEGTLEARFTNDTDDGEIYWSFTYDVGIDFTTWIETTEIFASGIMFITAGANNELDIRQNMAGGTGDGHGFASIASLSLIYLSAS